MADLADLWFVVLGGGVHLSVGVEAHFGTRECHVCEVEVVYVL